MLDDHWMQKGQLSGGGANQIMSRMNGLGDIGR